MKDKKIAIVSIGGVGGFLAAKLSEVLKVDLITSNPKNFEDGIVLIKKDRQKVYKNFNIYSTPPKDKIYDAIIFTTKSYALKDAAKKMLQNVSKETIILPLLNGIEPYEILKDIFKNSLVAKGAIYIISNKIDKNKIQLKGKGAYIVFGKEDIEPLTWLNDIFQKAGIKTKLTKDIDKEIWKKYLFIASTAALTTYYKKSFGEIAKEHLSEFKELLDEIIKIANQKGVNLNEEDKKRAIEILLKSPPSSKTSMQLDFENKNQSEIENILGYLAKESPNSKLFEIYELLRSV